MKRLISCLLAILMMFSLVACTTDSGMNSGTQPTKQPEPGQSTQPILKSCAQIGPDKLFVVGFCSLETEFVRVSGEGVTQTDIIPEKGEKHSYFFGVVPYSQETEVQVQGQETGKTLSYASTAKLGFDPEMKDMMTTDQYTPYFSKNSRMHYYSALLTYSLSDVVDENFKTFAKKNISVVVDAGKAVGAEVIYLVVPNSASLYPETVPDGFTEAEGESIYEAFKACAEEVGATVIYPYETMKAHRDDGNGLKAFHTTDSHWTTYGAYWALNDLMNYISQTYPEAKPVPVEEMGFYSKEMYAGDSFFTLDPIYGTENRKLMTEDGETTITGYKELAPLYKKKFGTDNITTLFRDNKSVYIDMSKVKKGYVNQENKPELPTALIMRDSFGCTIYDMLSDRFSQTYWQGLSKYAPYDSILKKMKPNYIINIVSDRNLVKLMLGNDAASILNLR